MKFIKTFIKNPLYFLVFLGIFVVAGAGIVYAITSLTVTDTFTDSSKIASAVNVTVDTVNGQVFLSPAAAWTCGSSLLDTRDGKAYATVLIGSQCWMQQNLNVGTMITSGSQGISTTSIKKTCGSNSEANCTLYGAYYQWDQVMGGSVVESSRGICPASWHIPSFNEWNQLFRAACTSATCVTDFPYSIYFASRGTNEGTVLKSPTGLFRINADFAYWSTTMYSTNSAYIQVPSAGAYINTGQAGRTNYYNLRCVKD